MLGSNHPRTGEQTGTNGVFHVVLDANGLLVFDRLAGFASRPRQ